MELQEFVAESLTAIIEGVAAAIRDADAKKLIGKVNPAFASGSEPPNWESYVQKVEFDVAVTATERSGVSGKGAIKVYSFAELGGDRSSSAENSTVSRIKFTIPLSLPAHAAQR
jgi:hypothetical protein